MFCVSNARSILRNVRESAFSLPFLISEIDEEAHCTKTLIFLYANSWWQINLDPTYARRKRFSNSQYKRKECLHLCICYQSSTWLMSPNRSCSNCLLFNPSEYWECLLHITAAKNKYFSKTELKRIYLCLWAGYW